jgi:uncharacterized membrane protein YfhO
LTAIGELVDGDDLVRLKQYLALVEAPGQPETTIDWSGFDALRMKATVAAGQSVLLQETYDPAWRAYENGKPLAIRRDPVMNFMLIDSGPGTHAVDLRFETPLENRAGQGLLVVSLLVVGGLMRKSRKPAAKKAVAAAAYGPYFTTGDG